MKSIKTFLAAAVLSLTALTATAQEQWVVELNDGSLATFNIDNIKQMYTRTAEATHDYVEIGGVKWATMNLGATTIAGSPSTCYGDYFACGDTEPRYSSISISNTNSVTFGGWKSTHSSGYVSSDMTSITSTTLDSAHDAATAIWGTAWRMPTIYDFQALLKACTGSTSAYTVTALSTSSPTGGIYKLTSTQSYLSEYKGVAGYLFVDKSDTSKRLFFPSAGQIQGTTSAGVGEEGRYWSSTIYSAEKRVGYIMSLGYSVDATNAAMWRYMGYSIRPVMK